MTKFALTAICAAMALQAALVAPATARVEGITAADTVTIVDRSKPRVKGGSGCDTPQDIAEHPECR